MSRYSPQVKPTSAPSGLAQALQSGMAGFQRERDRMEGQQDRARKRTIETDTLASQGLMPNLPETPETFGSAFTRALSGAPEPQPQAVVPGGFVVEQGDFEKVDPRTGQPSRVMRLPSGGTYDPSVMEGRLAGTTLAKGLAGNQVVANNRGLLRDEYGQAVVENGGTVAGAGSQGVIDSFLRKQPSAVQFTPANAGNQAGVFNKETQSWSPLDGTNAVPRATGTAGTAGGVGTNMQRGQQAMGNMNATNDLTGIDDAVREVSSNPDAFGFTRNVLGATVRDNLIERDPEENKRNAFSRGTLEWVIGRLRHDRFGAALSAREAEIAESVFSNAKSRPSAILGQLQVIRRAVERQQRGYQTLMGAAPQTSPDATTPPAGDLVSEFERRFQRNP